jgi:hypothetical protein
MQSFWDAKLWKHHSQHIYSSCCATNVGICLAGRDSSTGRSRNEVCVVLGKAHGASCSIWTDGVMWGCCYSLTVIHLWTVHILLGNTMQGWAHLAWLSCQWLWWASFPEVDVLNSKPGVSLSAPVPVLYNSTTGVTTCSMCKHYSRHKNTTVPTVSALAPFLTVLIR